MYAIIETGGKQYKVQAGGVIVVEKLDKALGETVSFDNVLFVGGEGEAKIGSPFVEGASVKATVNEHGRGKKLTIFKYKPKKNYKRKQGHRQPFTKLTIDKIDIS